MQHPSLTDQQVVVAGGSSGIGLGVARACLEQGAAVTLVGRSAERLAAAREQLGARASVVAADLTNEDDVRRVFADRAVDHVVVTAATLRYAPIRELALADARVTIDSKLIAAILVAKHARPTGSFTFTTGVAADRPAPGGAMVAAVNGAINALARALALELAPVRVNTVSPGWIDTPMWDAIAGAGKAELFAKNAARLPAARIGRPDEIAQAVVFLMTNGFTTGETLTVDGGRRLV